MIDMIEEFLAAKGLAKSTTEQYRRSLELAKELDLSDLRQVRAWLERGNWGSSTRWGLLACLKSYARWMYGDNHPLLRMRMKRAKSAPQRALSVEQVQQLLAAHDTRSVKGRRDLAICALMLDSGLRAAEICRVQLERVDLAGQSLDVIIKGGAWGTAVYSQVTASYIGSWLADRSGQARCANLFCSVGGTTPGLALTTDGLRAEFRRFGERAGIGPLSPHDLRRTFATLAILAGAPTRMVQIAGRWGDVNMVERYTRGLQASAFHWFPVEGALG